MINWNIIDILINLAMKNYYYYYYYNYLLNIKKQLSLLELFKKIIYQISLFLKNDTLIKILTINSDSCEKVFFFQYSIKYLLKCYLFFSNSGYNIEMLEMNHR